MSDHQQPGQTMQPPLPPRTSSLASPQSTYPLSLSSTSSRLPAGLVTPIQSTSSNMDSDEPGRGEGGEDDIPPSYEQTRLAEPDNARFGRWRNWVEKRGNERRQEREELKQSGKLEKTSWNLPPAARDTPGMSTGDEDEGYDEEEMERARIRDDQMEKRLLAASNPYRVSNPDPENSLNLPPSTSSRHQQEQERRSRSSSSASGGGKGAATRHRLTKNVTIEQLGSRFDRGLPDQPLCGMILPTQGTSPNTIRERDRFLLIGTRQGLYLADLEPVLSATAPLRTSPLPSSPSTSPAKIVAIWTGLAVHHLDCFVEPANPRSDGAKGLLLALVGNETELEIKMWSIAAIINLVKWRTYNENSKPLDLASLQTPHHSTHHNCTSSFSTIRSFLGSPSTKGKGKESSNTQSHSRNTSSDSSGQPTLSSTSTRSRTSSTIRLETPQGSESLPFEWYNSHVKLPLPKPHTPILFFKISKMPPRDREDDADGGSEEEEEDTEDLNNEQLRRKRLREEERGKLFLLVATKGVVDLFESGMGDKRSWKLTRELSAPSTPRFLQLVQSPELSRTSAPSPATASHHSSHSLPSPPSVPYPSTLCLLLGLSNHTVLIHLSSYDVVELELPSPPSPSLSRARTKSLSNSVRSTASSSTHRSTASLSFKDNPLVKKVQELVESKNHSSNVPIEFRGEKGIKLGRRVGGGGNDELFGENEELGFRGEWVGIDELIVPIRRKRSTRRKRFQLVSKGHSTHLVESPLTPHGQSLSNIEAQPSALIVKTCITFKWPSDQTIRRVNHLLTTTPEGQTHLTLIAFTSTGVCVQEGYLSLNSPSLLFTPTRTTTTASSHLSRLSLDELRTSIDLEEDDDDFSDQATLDFGRKVGWLSESLSSSEGGRGTAESGVCYVWTQEYSDYIIKRIYTNL